MGALELRQHSAAIRSMEEQTRRTLDRSKTEDVDIEVADEEASDSPSRISAIFKKYDANGDGTLSKEELKEVICKLNPPAGASTPTPEQLDAIIDVFMQEIDTNRNGTVEMKEFVQWMCQKTSLPASSARAVAFPSRGA